MIRMMTFESGGVHGDEIQRVQIRKAILTSGQIRGHKYKYTNVIVY